MRSGEESSRLQKEIWEKMLQTLDLAEQEPQD